METWVIILIVFVIVVVLIAIVSFIIKNMATKTSNLINTTNISDLTEVPNTYKVLNTSDLKDVINMVKTRFPELIINYKPNDTTIFISIPDNELKLVIYINDIYFILLQNNLRTPFRTIKDLGDRIEYILSSLDDFV